MRHCVVTNDGNSNFKKKKPTSQMHYPALHATKNSQLGAATGFYPGISVLVRL
jgi:hypothetical protein